MAKVEIRGGTMLPAHREDISFRTSDGLTLVGELATPLSGAPVATLVCLHPLPTHGGFMDSHVLRKAAARLPALADLAVLRFNTRGTSSPRGTSEGSFDHGNDEKYDVAAALEFARSRNLPNIWIVGWSFGTDLALKYTRHEDVSGVILLSPPLRTTTEEQLAAWADADIPVTALIPEHDDFLQPDAAREKFACAPNIELVAVEGGKHLWVGESQVSRVLTEIVARVNPAALPLPTEYEVPEVKMAADSAE